ncbi:MAG: hypothetical protein WA021_05665 [Minisyncoccia bacterium]
MMRGLAIASVLALSSVATAQDVTHSSDWIAYRTCHPGNEPFGATWHGNSFWHFRNPANRAAGHADTHMQYQTWGGHCFWVRWDAGGQQFIHEKGVRGGEPHPEKFINYITHHGSYFTAFRDGNNFFHLFVKKGPAPTKGDLEIAVNKALNDPMLRPIVAKGIEAWLKTHGVPVPPGLVDKMLPRN